MSSVLTWLPVAISVVIFLGAATVYLRGSKDKGTIQTLSRNNEALSERVGILEKDNTDLHVRVDGLARENETLRSVVTSREEIAALRNALDTHHAAAMMGVAQIHDDLSAINESLEGGRT